MNQTVAVWLVIVLSVALANLPFVNEKAFGVIPIAKFLNKKAFWFRLLELLCFYFLIGLLGMAIEASLGNPFKQKWEFFAITLSLFLVLAFPGFVFRYLLKR
jgi:hypothetical protein